MAIEIKLDLQKLKAETDAEIKQLMQEESPNLDLMLADAHLLIIIRELEESYNIPA